MGAIQTERSCLKLNMPLNNKRTIDFYLTNTYLLLTGRIIQTPLDLLIQIDVHHDEQESIYSIFNWYRH